MTRTQLSIVAVLSLLCTVAVLVGGGSRPGAGADLTALAADHKPITVPAAALETPADSGDSPSADDATPSADESAPDEVSTLDDSPAAADEGADTTPADDTADDDTGDDDRAGRGDGEAARDEPQPTKIRHVFVIALAGHGFDATFGEGSPATYLNGTLRPKGALLSGYRSLGTADLPDYLAMVGGQPPNADTRAGCPTFREIPPSNAPSRKGEIAADGCVYPNTVTTLGDQLSASRRTWRAYVEDLDKAPAGAAGAVPKTTCRHPESNGPDDTLKARAGDGYATRHNPFVYFHSLLDLGDCDANDGSLAQLDADLASVKKTASYSFIAPNLCNDGSESPCVDGSPGGLAAADAFLATWVPKILASPAYRADGLLIVTFAGSVPATPPTDPAAPPPADAPSVNGTLLVSRFAQADSTVASEYDPFSLLRSVEDLFALKPLARASDARSFATSALADAFVEPLSDA